VYQEFAKATCMEQSPINPHVTKEMSQVSHQHCAQTWYIGAKQATIRRSF